jgi:hypothetical protein
MENDRRKHSRYCVRGQAFAVFKPEPVQLVPIIDISLGGLGISVNARNGNRQGVNLCSLLEIMADDGSFYMDNLPYEFLSERRSTDWDPLISAPHRFNGIKFLNLMPVQKSELKHFIRNYTIGGLTPKIIRKFSQILQQFMGKKDFEDSCQNIWLQRPTL